MLQRKGQIKMYNSNDTLHLVCTDQIKGHIYQLSKICVNGSTYSRDVCIPELDQQRPYRIAIGIWALVVMIFGVSGNIFTLLAIPYAAKKQR